jgi:hypothetical protein
LRSRRTFLLLLAGLEGEESGISALLATSLRALFGRVFEAGILGKMQDTNAPVSARKRQRRSKGRAATLKKQIPSLPLATNIEKVQIDLLTHLE